MTEGVQALELTTCHCSILYKGSPLPVVLCVGEFGGSIGTMCRGLMQKLLVMVWI